MIAYGIVNILDDSVVWYGTVHVRQFATDTFLWWW